MDYEAIARELYYMDDENTPDDVMIEKYKKCLRSHFSEPAPAEQGEELDYSRRRTELRAILLEVFEQRKSVRQGIDDICALLASRPAPIDEKALPDGFTTDRIARATEGRYAGWVFVQHADGHWVTAFELDGFILNMLRYPLSHEAPKDDTARNPDGTPYNGVSDGDAHSEAPKDESAKTVPITDSGFRNLIESTKEEGKS